MEADRISLASIDPLQPPNHIEAGVLSCGTAGVLLLTKGDGSQPGGGSKASVLPEGLRGRSAGWVGNQAGQSTDHAELCFSRRPCSAAVGESGFCRCEVRIRPAACSLGGGEVGDLQRKLRNLCHQRMLTKSRIHRPQRSSASGILFLVGDHIAPSRQGDRDGMGGIRERMAEIAALPAGIPQQVARTHRSKQSA